MSSISKILLTEREVENDISKHSQKLSKKFEKFEHSLLENYNKFKLDLDEENKKTYSIELEKINKSGKKIIDEAQNMADTISYDPEFDRLKKIIEQELLEK